jgi:hypothetical protein
MSKSTIVLNKGQSRFAKVSALYDLLDAMMGEICEKGWEGIHRYHNGDPFITFCNALDLLIELDKDLGEKMEKQAIQFEILLKEGE